MPYIIPDISAKGYIEMQNGMKQWLAITDADVAQKVFQHTYSDADLKIVLEKDTAESNVIKARLADMADVCSWLFDIYSEEYISKWLYQKWAYGSQITNSTPLDMLAQPNGVDDVEGVLYHITGGCIRSPRYIK